MIIRYNKIKIENLAKMQSSKMNNINGTQNMAISDDEDGTVTVKHNRNVTTLERPKVLSSEILYVIELNAHVHIHRTHT